MKKTKIISTIMLVLFALAFIFNETSKESTPPSPPPPLNNEFIIGAMSIGDNTDYTNATDLHINLWHQYTGITRGWEGIPNDHVYVNPDEYAGAVSSRVSQNYSHNLATFYDRPKWVYLAYGESSNYECEDNHQNPNKWFYTYSTHTPGIYVDEQDGDAMVKHCRSIELSGQSQGWAVKDLKANREQCYGFWATDSAFSWYIMPRIRIPASTPSVYPDKKVCRIDILNWYGGDPIESRIIYAKNFAHVDSLLYYQGQYREEYYWNQLPEEIPSAIVKDGETFKAPTIDWTYDWNRPCGIDYRIWWYDEIEMWIDYVRVENEKAHKLFSGYFENPINWIQKEVGIAKMDQYQYPRPVHNMYIEEFELNIMPCVKYLEDKIKYWSNYYGVVNPTFSLTINVNEGILRQNIPNWNNSQHISAEFIRDNITNYAGGYRELVTTNYPLYGWRTEDQWTKHTRIPSSLPCGSVTYDESTGILADSRSPVEYDNWLQEYMENDITGLDTWYGDFIAIMKASRQAAKLSNMPFVPMLQTHL